MSESRKLKGLLIIGLMLSLLLTGCDQKNMEDLTGNVLSKGKEVIEYIDSFTSNETVRYEAKINTAIRISDMVKKSNIQKIDLKKVQSHDEYKKMIDNLNLMIQIINSKAGTNIKFLSKEIDAYNKFMLEVKRYSPLIDNYNSLIRYSYELNPHDEESVNILLTKTVGFTVEALLIVGGVFYQAAFIATGTFANAFGLTKLASVCGPCVSTVMSSMHWIIRDGLIEKVSEYSEKGVSSVI